MVLVGKIQNLGKGARGSVYTSSREGEGWCQNVSDFVIRDIDVIVALDTLDFREGLLPGENLGLEELIVSLFSLVEELRTLGM